jgi:hypothetical protein
VDVVDGLEQMTRGRKFVRTQTDTGGSFDAAPATTPELLDVESDSFQQQSSSFEPSDADGPMSEDARIEALRKAALAEQRKTTSSAVMCCDYEAAEEAPAADQHKYDGRCKSYLCRRCMGLWEDEIL